MAVKTPTLELPHSDLRGAEYGGVATHQVGFSVGFALSGLLFLLYPAIRPFSSEVGLDGAGAFGSASWVVAHSSGSAPSSCSASAASASTLRLQATAVGGRMLAALTLIWIGVGLTLPYYGAEVFGLHAVGQRALDQDRPGLVKPLTHAIRWEAGIYFILLGLVLLAVGRDPRRDRRLALRHAQPLERGPARGRAAPLHPAIRRAAGTPDRTWNADAHRLRLARLGPRHRSVRADAMTPMQRLLLLLRVLMEIGIVVALTFWGVHLGASTAAKIALGVVLPALGFGFWGAIDFHQAGRAAEPLRLLQELTVSLLATLAWYSTGRHGLGYALGGLSIVYHALVYAMGERLLKPSPAAATRGVDLLPRAGTELTPIRQRLTGALIGGVFGLIFVVANANTPLGPTAAVVFRILGDCQLHPLGGRPPSRPRRGERSPARRPDARAESVRTPLLGTSSPPRPDFSQSGSLLSGASVLHRRPTSPGPH